MPDPLAGLPHAFSGPPRRLRFLSLSGRTLEKHPHLWHRPEVPKIGDRVVYALDDLQAWADLGAKNSTLRSRRVGTVLPAKRQAAPAPLAYVGRERR